MALTSSPTLQSFPCSSLLDRHQAQALSGPRALALAMSSASPLMSAELCTFTSFWPFLQTTFSVKTFLETLLKVPTPVTFYPPPPSTTAFNILHILFLYFFMVFPIHYNGSPTRPETFLYFFTPIVPASRRIPGSWKSVVEWINVKTPKLYFLTYKIIKGRQLVNMSQLYWQIKSKPFTTETLTAT